MADNLLTKEIYLAYAKRIVSVLNGDDFYNQYKKRVDEGVCEFQLVKKRLVQDISVDWIATIEDCLPNLDTIVRNPRRFIVQEEDIVDVSLARAISTESIKHLAQHTNMIDKVEDDGTVIPNRILNITKEESFEIYENRFLFTLLLKLKDFVALRYDKIKKAAATQDVLQLNADSKFNLPSKKVSYRTEFMAQLSFDEVMRMDPETLDKIERIAKIDKIITDFLSSSFAKSMRNSAPVRPPITRTNVILKEPNFKKALTLWQFVETYQTTGGFSATDDVEKFPITQDSTNELRQMVTLNTMLFESLYDQHETDMNLDDAQFTDLLTVGDLDFGKDELERDEYAQKLDEEEQNKEAEKEEEVKPPEEEPQEEQTPEEQPPSEEEGEKEAEPPEPEVEIEEQEVEKEVDKDKEIEAPPKEEPEDEEPDAEQFDQNLFDVRKLYKRPEDDKLRQEEIAKVKDAIDRCLISYRKIKQEEIDEKEREEAAKRRAEELEKRAAAFKARRDELEQQGGQVYLGNAAFQSQTAKVLPAKGADFKKEHKELFVNKNERLDLTDQDLENIRESIEEMNRVKHKETVNINYADSERRETTQEEGEEVELPTVDLEAQLRALEEARRQASVAIPGMDDSERNLLRKPVTDGFVDKREEVAVTAPAEEIKPIEKVIKPTSSRVKRTATFAPVDENKVKVGNAPVKRKEAGDLLDDTFEEQRANLGNLSKPNTSKSTRKRKSNNLPSSAVINKEENVSAKPAERVEIPSEAPPVEEIKPIDIPVAEIAVELPVAEVKPAVKKPRKKAEPVDPWALSSTTLNQRYDVASGLNREFAPIDENKVKVGNAPVKRKDAADLLDDTFEEQRAKLGNLDKPNTKKSKPKKPSDKPQKPDGDGNA